MAVVVLHGESEIGAETRNVSAGGLLVTCAVEIPYGAAVHVRMSLPTGEVVVPATVRWIRDGDIGLQFGSLRAKETWAIHQLMKIAPTIT
jgi:type IV pilus assembly protein PilZ